MALVAVESTQRLKQKEINNNALSSSSLFNTAPVKTTRFYKHSIKGFLIENVPDEIASSLSNVPGVIRVEQDQVVFVAYRTEILPRNDEVNIIEDTGNVPFANAMEEQTPQGVTIDGGTMSSLKTSEKTFVIKTSSSISMINKTEIVAAKLRLFMKTSAQKISKGNTAAKAPSSSTYKSKKGNRLSAKPSGKQQTPQNIIMVGGPIKYFKKSKKVFVIDSGCSDETGDLNINKALSKNFADSPATFPRPAWYDGYGHGTHVAGIIAAIDNHIGVVGVVPGAEIVCVRVLDSNGVGYVSSVIDGINYAAQVGRSDDVINLSLWTNFVVPSFNDAIANVATNNGFKIAIAAGNGYGANASDYSPASAEGPNISTVACCSTATSLSDSQMCDFSNVGAPPIDFIAPGLDILSLSTSYGGTATMSGTSMSAAHVSGLYVAGFYSKRTINGYPFPFANAKIKHLL